MECCVSKHLELTVWYSYTHLAVHSTEGWTQRLAFDPSGSARCLMLKYIISLGKKRVGYGAPQQCHIKFWEPGHMRALLYAVILLSRCPGTTFVRAVFLSAWPCPEHIFPWCSVSAASFHLPFGLCACNSLLLVERSLEFTCWIYHTGNTMMKASWL